MSDIIGARLKRWREQIDGEDKRALSAGEPCGNYGEEFDELLAYAERMHSVLVEYGKARAARNAAWGCVQRRSSAEYEVFERADACYVEARDVMVALALELAEEE